MTLIHFWLYYGFYVSSIVIGETLKNFGNQLSSGLIISSTQRPWSWLTLPKSGQSLAKDVLPVAPSELRRILPSMLWWSHVWFGVSLFCSSRFMYVLSCTVGLSYFQKGFLCDALKYAWSLHQHQVLGPVEMNCLLELPWPVEGIDPRPLWHAHWWFQGSWGGCFSGSHPLNPCCNTLLFLCLKVQ